MLDTKGKESMAKLTITQGLPGSGKTTWAKEQQLNDCNIARVNRDDLRDMIDGGVYSKANEALIRDQRDLIITSYLRTGRDVICDDTNLEQSTVEQLKRLVPIGNGDTFEINDSFLSVPIEECIKRDAERGKAGGRAVGEEVIRKMANRHLRPKKKESPDYSDIKVDPFEMNASMPVAIICDIDGTIADHRGIRSPYDWNRVHLDRPRINVIDAVTGMSNMNGGARVFFVSGRDECCRDATTTWLIKHVAFCPTLFMRKSGDRRKDWIIKEEILREHVFGKYNIIGVFEDRRQMIAFYRKAGLGHVLFDVGNGEEY